MAFASQPGAGRQLSSSTGRVQRVPAAAATPALQDDASWSAVDLLLAPVAPLVASLPAAAPSAGRQRSASAAAKDQEEAAWAFAEWAGSTSKYDPLAQAIKASVTSTWQAPSRAVNGQESYDPLAALVHLVTHMQAPVAPTDGSDSWDPVAAARQAARDYRPPPTRAQERAAGVVAKYDPLPGALAAALALEAPQRGDGGARWDPVSWLLDGWAGDWEESTSASGGGHAYDPLAGINGWGQ